MTLINELTALVSGAFAAENLDPALGAVRVSDRPDLAQFQCNGALAAAKIAKTNPRQIAEKIAGHLRDHQAIKEVTIAGPGFLNLVLADDFLAEQLQTTLKDTAAPWSLENPEKIVLDYGGPNVAKPLHVGHLRAAIIGESLKRLMRFVGADVVSDVHFGDWGLQMGQLISELELTQPDLVYFQEDFSGPYPEQSPVSLTDLEKLYPVAAANCKADPERMDLARKATFGLQDGRAGYKALWQHFVDVSRTAIKQEYEDLGVSFDWWKGESDAHPFVADMVIDLTGKGLVEESDGAKIIRVKRDDDNKEIPPIMLITSEGSIGYHTTDLATIIDRVQSAKPDRIIYVVDQRQSLHFEQIFRASDMAGYLAEDRLEHLGFGTMNGKDGKPFKTREGGVYKLRDTIDMMENKARQRIDESGMAQGYDEAEIKDIAHKVGIAALKFADLSNPRTSDYIFDLDRFMAFEGKTGPYLLYASVRIKSILKKVDIPADKGAGGFCFTTDAERDLALCLLGFSEALRAAFERRMPHILCDHAYALAQAFSKFYANCRIVDESDQKVRDSRIRLIMKVLTQLDQTLDLLGIEVPARM